MSDTLWRHIVVEGGEASSYLQGQISQDVTDVPNWAALLEPNSTLISPMWVTRQGQELFVLSVPAGLLEDCVTRLQRFKLRSDCRLAEGRTNQDLPFSVDAERIRGAMPWTQECAAELTPHAFGPTFVKKTISFSKGCFTGQELVGRLDARGGNSPWRLISFTCTDPSSFSEWIQSVGPTGPQDVTSIFEESEGVWRGLAIAHRSLDVTRSHQGATAEFVE